VDYLCDSFFISILGYITGENEMKGKILITGGAGTLGNAFIQRSVVDEWECDIFVFSRDVFKHAKLKNKYPHVHTILGDVTDYEGVKLSVSGFDTVVHMAAQKVIPAGETNVVDTLMINTIGSLNVARACIETGVKHVVLISTDKSCHPVNLYGSSKYSAEKIFQEFSQVQRETKFHIVRYGNVLGSTGSVINVWKQHLEEYGKVFATEAEMTRFWLTSSDAVDLILHSLNEPSGTISIPRCPALSMRELAEYVLPEGTEIEYTGLRPGEKMFEELITREEAPYIEPGHQLIDLCPVMRLWPTTRDTFDDLTEVYTSQSPDHWLEKEELLRMIGE
jgi:UDP-N-acetylglucosamine 4,6-dehydratase/5-epimerase